MCTQAMRQVSSKRCVALSFDLAALDHLQYYYHFVKTRWNFYLVLAELQVLELSRTALVLYF